MTVQPDSVRFHAPGEVDDPTFTTWTPVVKDPTVLHPEPPKDLRGAANVVLHHIAEWWAADDIDVRVAQALAIVDLGRPLKSSGFAQLAWDYAPEMPTPEAEAWRARLFQYLTGHGYKETR